MIFDVLCKISEKFMEGRFKEVNEHTNSDVYCFKNNNIHQSLRSAKIFYLADSLDNYLNEITSIEQDNKDQMKNMVEESPLPFPEGTFICCKDFGIMLYNLGHYRSDLKGKTITFKEGNSIDAEKVIGFTYIMDQGVINRMILGNKNDIPDSFNGTTGVMMYNPLTQKLHGKLFSSFTVDDKLKEFFSFDNDNSLLTEDQKKMMFDGMSDTLSKAYTLICYINQPKKFIFEEVNTKTIRDPLKSPKIPRSQDRPKYTILDPEAIRKVLKVHNETGRLVTGHDRRGHWHRFMAERFVNAKGTKKWINSTWVGPQSLIEGNKKYRVLVDK